MQQANHQQNHVISQVSSNPNNLHDNTMTTNTTIGTTGNMNANTSNTNTNNPNTSNTTDYSNHWMFKNKKIANNKNPGATNLASGVTNNRESSTDTQNTYNSRGTSIRMPTFIETGSRAGSEGYGSLNQGFGFSNSVKPRSQQPAALSKDFKELIDSNKYFKLPTQPSGKTIKIELFSNWGDYNHIGLNGIEFFNENGQIIKFNNPEDSIWMQSTGRRKKPSIYNDPSFLARVIGGKF